MFSAIHPTTDIAKILRHVRFVLPEADNLTPFERPQRKGGPRPTRPTRPINAPRFRSRQLGNDSVDAVGIGDVLTGEEKLELQPPAEADDHGVRNITGSSGIPVGQQFAVLVHSVDAVLTGCVPTGAKKSQL